jgi:zinc transport system permease protein
MYTAARIRIRIRRREVKMFQYEFMVRAFIVGFIIAVITPCVGTVVVFKRFSMIGDTLSHASLAGVAVGLIAGINPVAGSVAACIIGAFSIEAVRKIFPRYAEISLAVILSTGVGLAGVLTGFMPNAANFNSFIFGSIVAISDFEFYLIIAAGFVILSLFTVMFKALLYITLDEEAARLSGVPVKRINFIFTFLIALTISVAVRTIGVLIISSLMVLPVACSMQVSRSFRQTTLISVLYGIAFVLVGLVVSFYAGLKPGGTIALTGVAAIVITYLFKRLLNINLKKDSDAAI